MDAGVDHLVYAAPDLEAAVDALERSLGVRAAPGGAHPGRGTRNALIALGPSSYLEIVGPDPDQPGPPRPRWLSVDAVVSPRLVRWAAPSQELEGRADAARRAGVELGAVLSGSRRRADGMLLSWRLTDPAVSPGEGIVPFFIDWSGSPHPAESAASGIALRGLRAEHPDPRRIEGLLRACGVDLEVGAGAAPALVATLETPRGTAELR